MITESFRFLPPSPHGGEPVQITDGKTPVQAPSSGNLTRTFICYVSDNAICLTGLENELPLKSIRLTERFPSIQYILAGQRRESYSF